MMTVYYLRTSVCNIHIHLGLRPQLVLQVLLKRTLGPDELHIGTILQHLLVRLELQVIRLVDVSETPLLRNNDLLAAGELVPSTAKSFHDDGGVGVLASNGQDDLSNIDSCNGTIGFAPGATHTSLESISSSTAQHLVNPNDMEGVHTDTEMERILSAGLGDVFVGADTGSFQCFR